ncbi:MAG: MaoC/PaaZ C-terminal domain-containing protein [Candidatus Bathyarchaeia archaeon]
MNIEDSFTTRTRYISGSEIELLVGVLGVHNPIFLNGEEAENKGFEDKITPGALIDAYAFGLEYQTGIYDHIVSVVEVDEMKFKAPLHQGDPLRSELEVIHKRETSRSEWGLVTFQRRCYAREKEIMEAKLKFLYFKKKNE